MREENTQGVCRSSLGAEAVDLGNCADLSIWIRVLPMGMILGRVFKELVGPIAQFKLLIPFGAVPANEDVFSEMFGKAKKDSVRMSDIRGGSKEKGNLEKEMSTLGKNPDYLQSRHRLLLIADSYN